MDALITQLATLGVGGLIASLVLVWKRGDDKERFKEKEDHAKALETLFARMELRDKMVVEIVQANTSALVALQATVSQLDALKKLNDRINDLERKRG